MRDNKIMFLREVCSEISQSSYINYERVFDRLDMHELGLNPKVEFYNLYGSDLEKALTSMLSNVGKSLSNQMVSLYSRYLKWAILKGLRVENSEDDVSIFRKVNKSIKIIQKENNSLCFISRQILYSRALSLKNKKDTIAYLAVFEGIYGKSGKELLELKLKDLSGLKVSLMDRDVLVPKEVMDSMLLAENENGYINKEGKVSPYEDSTFIFKGKQRYENREEGRTANAVSEIFRERSKQQLGKVMMKDSLQASGKNFYLKCIELYKGSLTDELYLQVANRYDKQYLSNSTLYEMRESYVSYTRFCEINNISFELTEALTDILIEILSLSFTYPRDYRVIELRGKSVNYGFTNEEIKYLIEVDTFDENSVSVTEKDTIIKGRVGQGIFKRKLQERSSCCEICGFDFKELLIASHCKPWSMSSNKERLNPDNGLLLCPSHDLLFDKGLISFKEDGSIVMSNKLSVKQYRFFNISGKEIIILTKGQCSFINWHRSKFSLLGVNTSV
jgi:hypothetical protein